MKLSIIIVFILTIIHFAFAQTAVERETGSLTIVVTGLENDDGEVLISVSNSREDYESDDRAFVTAKATIEDGQAKYTFEAIPFGEYAIKLFHDENMVGALDSNFLGIPTEDYAFSNNATGSFGPADYDDAKFIFEQSELMMETSVD